MKGILVFIGLIILVYVVISITKKPVKQVEQMTKLPRSMLNFSLGSSLDKFVKKHKYVVVPEEEVKEYYFPKGLHFGQKIFILDEEPIEKENRQITVGFYNGKLFTVGVMNLMPSVSWQKFIDDYIEKYGKPTDKVQGVFFWEDDETLLAVGKVEAMGMKAFNVILNDKY